MSTAVLICAFVSSGVLSVIPTLLARVLNPARSILDCHNAPIRPEATKVTVFEPYSQCDTHVLEALGESTGVFAGFAVFVNES